MQNLIIVAIISLGIISCNQQVDSSVSKSQDEKSNEALNSQLTNREIEIIDSLNFIRNLIIHEGADFCELEEKYSEDTAEGVICGEYRTSKTSFSPEVNRVFDSLGQCSLSEPCKSVYGYHIMEIFKLNDDSIHFRHIMIKYSDPVPVIEKFEINLDSMPEYIN